MHTIAETEQFKKRVKAIGVTEVEVESIISKLAEDPGIGTSLGGGLYKARVARTGGGKSGGYRVIYFYRLKDMPLFLLTLFAKNEKANISAKEKQNLIKLGDILVENYRR